MLRQLGIPTWFCSFSSADMRWAEVVESILKTDGDLRKASELDWVEKCEILRSNPITAARMFDHRFHIFMKEVIMSSAEPIGKIKDYFYRIEFQQRGSPHTHCLFWVEDAPKVDKNDDESVVAFVDKYVTCELPCADDDAELHEIVSSVQKHSFKHSKTCKKKGTTCRFNFPRPVSNETFICRPHKEKKIEPCEDGEIDMEDLPEITAELSKEAGKHILESMWTALCNNEKDYQSVNDLFDDIGISQDIFQQACSAVTNKEYMVLKRQPQDVWINQYNPSLLRCWDANMDIQYVFDAYSCVVYIISYISKAEREMGLLLDHAQREATKEGNSDSRQAMKKLGTAYLHNREVSAQEAAYRVCNLRLKEGSRKVQFIAVGENPVKISLPLNVIKRKSQAGEIEEEDMWMTSIVDRYKKRPIGEEFDTMCLATFCSEYRVLSKSEVANVSNERRKNPAHELQDGLGHIQKRSRTEPAVIRYPRFSPTKDPEKYYRSILQLFLPYRCDAHLKPNNFETYENFYTIGAVKCGALPLDSVKSIVDNNRALYEKDAEVIDEAQEILEKNGPLEDAWAQICPESELERLETSYTFDKHSDEDSEGDIPDLLEKDKRHSCTEVYQSPISRTEAEPLLRSLNRNQTEIFYKIRGWCLDKVNGKNPEPFYLFVTGGAGTGKSHLIKAVCYEATRILARIQPNPDDASVLLSAPTGVAAFNIRARTIHNILSIGIEAKLPYQPLGQEKINTLRSKLSGVQIFIVDEVSMVDQRLLCYIHGRLRQIKQSRDFTPFGKVCILAVGDFYQLHPVKGRPVFFDDATVSLWNDNFCIAQLFEIMRQKEDAAFAHMLNRLRVRKKKEPLDESDLTVLQRCETGIESAALHIFATNAEVDKHNLTCLHSICQDTICIEAQDFSKDGRSGKLEKRDSHHVRVFNTSLPSSVILAEGARVMLTQNIDVSDGLVNGVFGTVSFISKEPGSRFPSAVYVVFDISKVGEKLRRQNATLSSLPENSTPIKPVEQTVAKNGGIRRQFPLKLAWASTVHKVQGLTLKEAVVSLGKIFAAGQAYVALSRVTSIGGLTIQDFKENAIYCDEKVQAALANMLKFIPTSGQVHASTTIMLHNVQGLQSHLEDVKCDQRFSRADFICLTESWLTATSRPELKGFELYQKPRSLSYDELFADLKRQAHGGVAVYRNISRNCEFLDLPLTNMEYLAFHIPDENILVAVIYRPPSYKADIFRRNVQQLLDELDTYPSGKIVMGDFNENVLDMDSPLKKLMERNNFQQCVEQPTTESGTLIDHVYVHNVANVKVEVVPTYFSFHEAVSIRLCRNEVP